MALRQAAQAARDGIDIRAFACQHPELEAAINTFP
jgi:ribulose-bisphosphate carboxylase large chain